MKKVEIYSTPTCQYCKMTKEFLTANNHPYTDYDVSTDATKRQEMIEKSGQMGVPVIVITDDEGKEEMMVGFDEAKLRSLLGIE